MKKTKVNRNTWAKIGQVITVIGGVLLVISAILGFLNITPIPGMYSFYNISGVIYFLIILVLGIVVLLIELDYVSMPSHLVRGIILIVLGIVGAGLLPIVGGVFYIIADFVK